MVRESEHAESKADFIHKLSIALKEANESEYWIDLLYHSNYLDEKQYESIIADIIELKRIITAILLSMKKKKS